MSRRYGDETNLYVIIIALVFYLIVGTVLVWPLAGLEGVERSAGDPDSETIALVVFWPLFVLKWAGIGAWHVLVAGWTMLVS